MDEKPKAKKPIRLSRIPMPVFPAKPTKAINGRQITQEMIDDFMQYDPTFRTAYLYVNETKAHNSDGQTNKAVLARFPERPYVKGDKIWIDAEIQRLFINKDQQKDFEKQVMLMASDIGGYPGRSVDMLPNVPEWHRTWLFEGVALTGAARDAISNLPRIKLDDILKHNEMQSFSLDLSKNTKENLGMEKEEIQKLLDEQKKAFLTELSNMQKTAKDEIQLALDAQKKELTEKFNSEQEKQREQIKQASSAIARKEVDAWINSPEIIKRVKSTERENYAALRLALKDANVENSVVTFSMDEDGKKVKKDVNLEQAFVALVENLTPVKFSKFEDLDESKVAKKEDPVMIVEGEDDKMELKLSGKNKSEQRLNLVYAIAAKEKIDLSNPKTLAENFAKAEAKAMQLALDSENAKDLFGDSELEAEVN